MTKTSILTTEELEDVKNDQVIADYEPESSMPSIELNAQEKKVVSDAKYAAVEISQDGTLESHICTEIFSKIFSMCMQYKCLKLFHCCCRRFMHGLDVAPK